jgi:hypothetical protein
MNVMYSSITSTHEYASRFFHLFLSGRMLGAVACLAKMFGFASFLLVVLKVAILQGAWMLL